MKIYNKKSIKISTILALYLLITIISRSFIVKHNEGPLRNKS